MWPFKKRNRSRPGVDIRGNDRRKPEDFDPLKLAGMMESVADAAGFGESLHFWSHPGSQGTSHHSHDSSGPLQDLGAPAHDHGSSLDIGGMGFDCGGHHH
jgi:hypothetical protein